jgi:hypothetical protein
MLAAARQWELVNQRSEPSQSNSVLNFMTDSSRNIIDRCVYCGSAAKSDDHIPPKTIFPKPRPSNLVTVRSCKACNEGDSKDDEYFRNVLVFREDSGSTSSGEALWESVRRSLHRPQARKFTLALANAMFDKPVETPGGIFLGTASAMRIDRQRINHVVKRITRGLYAEHFGRMLPLTDKIQVYCDDSVDRFPPTVADMLGELVTITTSQPYHIIGDDVFEYCFSRVTDHPTASAWAMRFYSSVHYFVVNVPSHYAEIAKDALSLDQNSGTQNAEFER